MKILVLDFGATEVKMMVSSQAIPRVVESGPMLNPAAMLLEIQKLTSDWQFDAVSIGFPGPVYQNRLVAEPWNFGKGWMGFDFAAAFKCPVKVMNETAMQALGSYRGGKMLFLGLGIGLGSTMIANGIIEPIELGHLPYKKSTFGDYLGIGGLQKHGKPGWRRYVTDVAKRLTAALDPDEVVLGGGNVHKLEDLPPGCRVGQNASTFIGGFRLWEATKSGKEPATCKSIAINGRQRIGPLAIHNALKTFPTDERTQL